MDTDTIVAPATLPGSGAISIVRISGPRALEAVSAVVTCNRPLDDAPGYSIRYGTALQDDGSILDEVLVSVFRAPHSYTGEEAAEISCHASRYVVETLLQRLCDAGARAAEPGEFTRRAFVNGKMDLAQAEAVADVIQSDNAAAHRVAMNQLRGGYSSRLKELRDKLLEVTALMELELDFSEEDVEFADRSHLVSLVEETLAHIRTLTDSFRLGNAIKTGIPVAIVGATNTGKSTLLNALLGEDRAIVSDIAGTTRDTVEETFNINGTVFRLIDTAGIRETEEEIEKIGISRSLLKLSQADIVLGVIDATAPLSEQRQHIQEIASRIRFDEQTLLLLLNKMDLVAEPSRAEDTRVTDGKMVTIPLSAKTGHGLETLKNSLMTVWEKRLKGAEQALLVTNIRHYNALHKAADALELVKAGIASGTPTDLVSQDMRDSLYHLGSILGTITDDEILGRIFERFCIGK
ncbi:MAG: tRNA uridine-5-carboxymethylaminomethyl(34) synthesis GTPase MnmE [Bacteroidales bacterium]|nr:tRNA uridine-5-carboxymethylaminomethyl(34) synthesis GTPase MnmE [Bacteroidales bacterium]